jgi:uncharacterized protein (TIGR02246 family)
MQTLLTPGLLCLLGVFGLTAIEPELSSAQTSDEKEIRALYQRFATAFQAKDLDSIMAWYEPSQTLFVFDVVPPRQYVGINAYRKDWEALFAAFPVISQFAVNDLSITTDGRLAYAHCVQHMVAQDAKGKRVEINFRVTDGFQKVNGRWLVTHEHVSVPVDLATSKADLLSKRQ